MGSITWVVRGAIRFSPVLIKAYLVEKAIVLTGDLVHDKLTDFAEGVRNNPKYAI